MLLVFVFGRVLTTSGYMPLQYKSLLLPGIMALSMLLSGIQAVAMPTIAEFQFTREIEDRLLSPIEIEWVAVEKIVSGMIQALAAGLVVLPAAWALLGKGVDIRLPHPWLFVVLCILIALVSSAIGLTLGCSIGQTHIGLMFSLVLAPMIFFGCTYYPWSALANFPILKRLVLLNPVVYASEGLRAALVPQFPHLPLAAIFAALLIFNAAFISFGIYRFDKKAVH
jgi:ABC-2 type transport system permease protein